MSDAPTRRRGRSGGGAARRAERTAVKIETARYIERNIPNFEVLNEEALQIIEANAETVLEEIGVNFVDSPTALERWREAGADIQGERVHIPKGLARQLCATAPSSFVQHARNPEKNVVIGGNNLTMVMTNSNTPILNLQSGSGNVTGQIVGTNADRAIGNFSGTMTVVTAGGTTNESYNGVFQGDK